MKIQRLAPASLLLPLILVTGCATNTPAPASKPVAQVPTLTVKLDCGSCQVNPKVPSLLVDGYNAAASQAGAVVVADKQATVTIKSYVARGDAARFLAGALAGKDEIQAEVAYQDKKFAVEDYYRNAWMGIEPLAKKIGEMTFEKLK